MTYFIFLAPKSLGMVTVAMKLKDACFWKESYDKPRQHIKKQRHHWPTKVHIVKAKVFLIVMYGCESWTMTKAEGQRINAFKLWCRRRLLRVPWAANSNQSILKEINPEYSVEGLMLKLKLQYLSHLMQRADSLEKTLLPVKIEGKRRRGWQRIRWLESITNSMYMNLNKLREIVKDREAWHAAVHVVTKNQTGLRDWSTKSYQAEQAQVAFIVLNSCNLGINFPYTEIETQKQGAVITKTTQYKHQSSCRAAGSKGLDGR